MSDHKQQPGDELPRSIDVGVVVERRDSSNAWADHNWAAIEVVDGWNGNDSDASNPWQVLEKGEGFKRWLAGPVRVELFKKETAGYKVNLGQPVPQVYVVLRTNDDPDTHHEIDLFLATVCPYEAESYAESGDEIVCGVPMVAEIAAWVGAFVDQFHVEVPFKKRKQKSKRHAIPERGGPRV
ncbi:MAG: DUF3305 domain-containing protein [Rhodospirillaceae bacterium]|nr:DUF3305 domain-containing protein [Rhodospirillaceae bacterium]